MNGHSRFASVRRSIDPDWEFMGDDETPARYIAQLADALWRHEHAGNWATLGALVFACGAVFGDDFSRNELDTNPHWRLDDAAETESPLNAAEGAVSRTATSRFTQ